MGQKLSYLDKKNLFIKKLNSLGCNLLRDDDDIDFGLVDKTKEDDIYNYLSKEKFICSSRDTKKMNFKKFIDEQILDIDVDIDMNTKYIQQYFYDIEIKKEFQIEYFNSPKKYQIAMKCVRYMMLLRAREPKYKLFFLQNRDFLQENNFFIDKLSISPFKKDFTFDEFIKIISADKLYLLKYVRLKYILFFIFKKVSTLFKIRGKIVAIDGVDGAGKSSLIKILSDSLNKPTFYMGERGFLFDKIYKNPNKSLLMKPISFFLKYMEKIYRYIQVYKASKRYSIVFTDRYHRYSKTAMKNTYMDFFNKLFFRFYPKADIYIVLWNEADVILKRKQEVSKEYIEEFNATKEKEYKDAFFIKNDNIDDTLNLILKRIYA
jgi:thymidylate kinase